MLVFTNGCFDILHPGHITLLQEARSLGGRLIVGLNSDASARALKGPGRPLLGQEARRKMLLELRSVDEVVVFDELTPQRLIEEVKPDILVKGGDWQEAQIAGARFVRERGGQVVILPLVEGFSTSTLIQLAKELYLTSPLARVQPCETEVAPLAASVAEHQTVIAYLRADLLAECERIGCSLVEHIRLGGKLLIAGNGGSAADAQHMAAELMVRFKKNRRALPSVALTTDASILTAHSNDFGFETVFVRQLQALAHSGDIFMALSTSGKSPSIVAACRAARMLGCLVIALTGETGGDLVDGCDELVRVPSANPARIQEAHALILHLWCEQIDALLF